MIARVPRLYLADEVAAPHNALYGDVWLAKDNLVSRS